MKKCLIFGKLFFHLIVGWVYYNSISMTTYGVEKFNGCNTAPLLLQKKNIYIVHKIYNKVVTSI